MTGVTTILSVIAKPALIQWSANEAVKYVRNEWTAGVGYSDESIDLILKEAKSAHRKKKEDAGLRGTDIHAEIEAIIKLAIASHEGYINGIIHADEMVSKFIGWAKENNVKFLSCEQQVYSEKYWIAGTYDFLCEINGKKLVGDIKTSSGIYGREYFAQCAGYRLMLEEHGETGFEGSVIVRLGKDGSFEEKYSLDYETDRKLFLACLDVYRAMGTFETK